MKKYLSVLPVMIFSSLVFIPASVSATSGACSYHNGVNCSAGASYAGNVQCNDGWINSSVYFSDAQECKVTVPACPYPTYSQCDVEYAKQQAQQRADFINNSNSGLYSSRGMTLMQPPLVDYTQDDNYLLCKDTQALYQAGQDRYNKCINEEAQNYIEALKPTESKCQQSLGTHGYLNTNTNTCSCNGDYWLKNGQCVEPKLYCTSTLGSSSHPSSDSCVCNDGYSGYSGKCTENYKETKTIDYEVKSWLDQGGRCNNNSHFSVEQEQRCVLYQTNPNTYHWKVLDEVVAEVPPVMTTSTPKLNIKNLPKGSYTSITQSATFTKTPANKETEETTIPRAAQQRVLVPILSTTSTTSIPTKQEPQKVSTQKHWYQWLNPFSWFK